MNLLEVITFSGTILSIAVAVKTLFFSSKSTINIEGNNNKMTIKNTRKNTIKKNNPRK